MSAWPLVRGALPMLLAGVLLPACTTTPKSHWLPYDDAAPRPRDPWVLRCVLDKHPRMLVVALDKDLWAAYDTQTCTLYKTWRGDVNFDGPVYTTMHGPQPTTRGDDLEDPSRGSSWFVQPTAYDSGDPEPAAVSFHGHRFVDGHVQLLYALAGPDGSAMNITETIEVSHPNAGGVEFVRQFDFDPFPGQWHPLLVGPEVRPDPHGHGPPEWRENMDRMEGMHRSGSVSFLCGPDGGGVVERDMFVFAQPTCTARLGHDIDLHSLPRGVPAADVIAEAKR